MQIGVVAVTQLFVSHWSKRIFHIYEESQGIQGPCLSVREIRGRCKTWTAPFFARRDFEEEILKALGET